MYRLITEFRILIRTMPAADLMFLVDASFVDMGSHWEPIDEVTEDVHGGYEITVGRNRSARAWARGIQMASSTYPYTNPGKNLGSASGDNKPPTGTRSVDLTIAGAVERELTDCFREDKWKDSAGKWHSYNGENRGVNGIIPESGLDKQRTGRAIANADITELVFNSNKTSSLERKNIIVPDVTAEQYNKSIELRRKQT